MRKDGGIQIDSADKRREQLSSLWSAHRDHRPLLGNRCEPDFEIVKFSLQIILHQVEDARCSPRRGGDMETIGSEPGDDAIVENKTVCPEHDRVTAPSDLQVAQCCN